MNHGLIFGICQVLSATRELVHGIDVQGAFLSPQTRDTRLSDKQ